MLLTFAAFAFKIASCTPALIYDADTLTCAEGAKLRVAGVNAQELKGPPCPRNYPCPAMRPEPARRELARLLGATIVGRRSTGHLIVRAPALRYRVVGRNHDRLVAVMTLGNGGDVRCALQASGAAAEWPKFVRRYQLRRCPSGLNRGRE